MAVAELGQVVDTNPEGRAGEAAITVPHTWFEERVTVEVTLPMRLRCHACGGGGCDGCQRRGAFRLDEDAARRRFVLPLPAKAGTLRLADPVDAGEPELILLTVREGDAENVRRLTPERSTSPRVGWWVLAAAGALGAVAYALNG